MFDNLRRIGEDKFRGACPFHGGDNPNGFAVVKYKGQWAWHCFNGGCGRGDALDAHKLLHGGTFPQALNALDGGEALPAPPKQKKPPGIVLVCDACGRETLEVEAKTYGNGTTRALYVDPPYGAALGSGWEIAAEGIACVGPECLERIET
jgi:DNA primase